MKNIVSLSGGKDSTAMLFMMLERGVRVDEIVFIDTTKEFPQLYDHIELVRKRVKDIKYTRLSIPFDYYFKEKSRGEEKGYGWPRWNLRWCTGLKRERFKKYIRESYGYSNVIVYIGIAYDEKSRCKTYSNHKNYPYKVRCPLVEWKIDERKALEYCYKLGFRWGGLYEHFKRLSCYLCPLQRIKGLRYLYNKFPELWKEMKELDKVSRYDFKYSYTLDELEDKFEKEKRERLFDL